MSRQALPARLLLRKLDLIFCYREEVVVAGMDWINCNLCCRQPGDERERTFTLSSCGHIFCDMCLARVESREKCAVCSSVCQLMQLSSKMKPDAEVFFQEPATLLRKHFTLITRLLDFQKDHRIRLVSFHRKIVQKYRELEKKVSINKSQEAEKYSAAQVRIQELEREVHRLRSVLSTIDPSGGAANSSAIPGKSPSPKVSPGSTMISPGRLTMVKKNQGLVMGGRGIPNTSPTAPYGAHQGGSTRARTFSPVACQYFTTQHQQLKHPESHPHPIPGISYYKNISPAILGKSSPVNRSMSGPPGQLPMPASSHGHSGTPGFQPFMRPPQSQPRPHTSVSYLSPDPYGGLLHSRSALGEPR